MVPGRDSVLNYTKNDAWAAGFIAHTMVSPDYGPFGAQDNVTLFAHGDYQDIPPCYSQELKDVVRGLLAVDPEDRLSADQAIVILEGFLGIAVAPPQQGMKVRVNLFN
jgi:hypothetical protein